MSGASKLFALVVTYPYQVVRSRIQVRIHNIIPTIPPSLTTSRNRIMPQHTYTQIFLPA